MVVSCNYKRLPEGFYLSIFLREKSGVSYLSAPRWMKLHNNLLEAKKKLQCCL